MTSILNLNALQSDDAVRLSSRLAATLTASQQVIVFTGTESGQGVSTVAADVAVAFARITHQQVLLIDARADAPGLHERFGTAATPGLAEVLEGGSELQSALVRGKGDGLAFLPLGRAKTDLVALFGSDSCARLLQLLRSQFRLVVIDVDAILVSAAASVLAARADGVVAVVVSGDSKRADLVELKRVVDGLKVPLLGAVLAGDASLAPGSRHHRGDRSS